MSEFRMPSLGADMEAGTLVEWLVKPGDEVRRGDIVAVVETQKGAIEIEIFQHGVVERILVDLGATVPVGAVLATIVAEDMPDSATVADSLPLAPPATAHTSAKPATPAATGAPSVPSVVWASPAARRAAQARGVDIALITGSGPSGAIVLDDVLRQSRTPAVHGGAKGLALTAMRAAIAAAMSRSKREIPHYYLQHDVDVSAATQWLVESNASRPPGERLLFGALVLKAIACAARKHPAFNGHFVDGNWRPAREVHAGVAISIRGGGLAAPAIHDVDGLSLTDLMARLRDLVQRTRAGRMRSSELADATITVSSLGDRGVEVLYGIIYPPQVALVGVGRITPRPRAVEGAVALRPGVTLTLAGDHRVSDGHAGSLFLSDIGILLQRPETL